MPLKLRSASRDDIENAVYCWMALLAEEKYEEAYDLTFHDRYFGWTPGLIESVINGYGTLYEPFDEIFKVTPPAAARFERDKQTVYKDITFFSQPCQDQEHTPEIKRVGYTFFTLPLNGSWSDLSVTFAILKGPGFAALELNEIHVF